MPVNYDPYGFDSFDTMFGIVFVIIAVGFVIVFGSIIVCGFQGAAQWKKNNDSPVLTVEAEVVAKRMDIQTWHHTALSCYLFNKHLFYFIANSCFI